MSLRVDVFDNETKKASHPAGDLKVPNGYKITGGGALEFYSPPGNMLTAAYPKSLQTWSVAGKDHEQTSPAVIKAFVLALFDPFL